MTEDLNKKNITNDALLASPEDDFRKKNRIAHQRKKSLSAKLPSFAVASHIFLEIYEGLFGWEKGLIFFMLYIFNRYLHFFKTQYVNTFQINRRDELYKIHVSQKSQIYTFFPLKL